MRTEYITTRVRPIRKLFIIESNDFDAFKRILKEISYDIEMLFNVILENNDQLFSMVNIELIKRQSIDLIFNLSKLDNDLIQESFSIECLTPSCDTTKIGRYVTDLRFISNLPPLVHKYSDDSEEDIFYSKEYITDNSLSAINSVNFGLCTKDSDDKEFLSNSAFKNFNFIYTDEISKIQDIIVDKNKHYCRLYNQVNPFSSGYGSSIHDIDFSHSKYFTKNKHIFISSLNDLAGILYFWNMRAVNPGGDFFWIPEENIEEFIVLFDEETIIIAHNEKIKEKVIQIGLKHEVFISDRLYFYGASDSWKFYQHSQTITIINKEEVFFSHPLEKTFSEFGMGGACILEIKGLKELSYPNHFEIGKLFIPTKFNQNLFSERFTHLHNNKLSKYYVQFSAFDMRNLNISLRLPDFKEVIEFMFKSKSYTSESTDKTSIFNQLISAVGGVEEINLFSNQVLFDLLVKMIPKSRTIKIDTYSEEIDKGNIELTPVIRTLKDIMSMSGKAPKDSIEKIFQNLSNKKLLLRGKHFKCEYCSSNIWIPIENIDRVNYCYACNNEIHLPISIEDKFRLNQLLIKAIDQGQLSTLLLLNFFEQKYRNLEYISNQNIFNNGESQAITDIDLIIKIGNKIGFAECKSTGAFENKQIDDLISISIKMKCDFIMLSSLQTSSDNALQQTIKYIKEQELNLPLFIFCKENLFEPASIDFYKYFEVDDNNEFRKGVILLGKDKRLDLK